MKGIVSKSLENKIWEVAQFGIDRDNDTRESINQIEILEFHSPTDPLDITGKLIRGINLNEERLNCIDLYENLLRKDWNEKSKQEDHHYKFLNHALLHKINATKYFHNEGIESRKNIIFSDDCISSIQLIAREEEIGLDVHMRSSDIINLLPLDLIALTSILYNVMEEHKIKAVGKRVRIHITFGSLHIYKKDLYVAQIAGITSAGEVYNETIRNNL